MTNELKINDDGLACPCCGKNLKLPKYWYLDYEPPPESCVECGSDTHANTIDSDGRCDSCHARAEYRSSDEYREICVRRNALQDADALSAIAKNGGYVARAARQLGLMDADPRSVDSNINRTWFEKWLRERNLMPAVYEIRKQNGWRGDPPRYKPRKRGGPVLAFSRPVP